MAEANCALCERRRMVGYYAYYAAHAVCSACSAEIISDLGCDCDPDFHEMSGCCETPPTDEVIAGVVVDSLRDRKHAQAALHQGVLA